MGRLNALGLDVSIVNRKATLVEEKPFVKDTDGEVALGDFSCSIFLGCYFISLATYYMFCLRHFCELLLKWIG